MENERIDFFARVLAELGAELMKLKRLNNEHINAESENTVKNSLDGIFNDELRRCASLVDSQPNKNEEPGINNYIYFTEKEIKSMPEEIKKILTLKGKSCHLSKRTVGNCEFYEIRFRKNGYNISASGQTIEKAKKKFFEKLAYARPVQKVSKAVPTTFIAFATYYFENFRRPKLSDTSIKHDLLLYKNHLFTHFGNASLRKITPLDCKSLLDSILARGHGKTCEDVRCLLNQIFKGAIAHGILTLNPLDIVFFVKHERETGTILTKEEQDVVLEKLKGTPAVVAVALSLYCGLRPNEWQKCRIDGEFIVAVNSKRKTKRVEYKRIFICDRLKPFIENGIPKFPAYEQIRVKFKEALPNHSPKDLRKTFNSKCKELGVSDHARKHFMGHSDGVLDSTYTYLSDDYLKSEGKKLNAW